MTDRPIRDVDDRLADWVDGRMSDRERERFLAELRVNAQLRQDLADYERTVGVLRAALRAPTAPAPMAERILAAIANQQAAPVHRRLTLSWRHGLWSLASAAALLVCALWIDNWSSPGPMTTTVAADDLDAAQEPSIVHEVERREMAHNPGEPGGGAGGNAGGGGGGGGGGLSLRDGSGRPLGDPASGSTAAGANAAAQRNPEPAKEQPPVAKAPTRAEQLKEQLTEQLAQQSEVQPTGATSLEVVPAPTSPPAPMMKMRVEEPLADAARGAESTTVAKDTPSRSQSGLREAPASPAPAAPTGPGGRGSRPASPGPGPASPGPSGPATGGPAGPSTGGPGGAPPAGNKTPQAPGAVAPLGARADEGEKSAAESRDEGSTKPKAPPENAPAGASPADKEQADKAGSDKAASNKAASNKAGADQTGADKAVPEKASDDFYLGAASRLSTAPGKAAGEKSPAKLLAFVEIEGVERATDPSKKDASPAGDRGDREDSERRKNDTAAARQRSLGAASAPLDTTALHAALDRFLATATTRSAEAAAEQWQTKYGSLQVSPLLGDQLGAGRDDDAKGEKRGFDKEADADTAPIERTWLVEGDARDVQALLSRMATFAREHRWELRSGETPAPAEAKPMEAKAPESKQEETKPGLAKSGDGKPVAEAQAADPSAAASTGRSPAGERRRIVLRVRVRSR